jgi:hypothetical protein
MLQRNLLYVLGALMLILWAGQPVQSQSGAEKPLKEKTCGNLWRVEQDKKWGYIDKTGRLIIPFKFDGADDFSEGLAAVSIKGKTGYIDETGKFVISPPSFSGYPFSSGMALVITGEFTKDRLHMHKLGYIDRSGKLVIKRQALDTKSLFVTYKDLYFSEGLATIEENDKVGFMDRTGKIIIPPTYINAQSFSEGLAVVMLQGQYGYIDQTGRIIIPFKFDWAGNFSEGLAAVESSKGKVGYIDKTGKLVINGEEFVDARGFSEGLAAARGKNDEYGFIDKTGKFVIQPQFFRVGDFSEGLAAVSPVKASWPGNLAYINQSGQIVIQSMSTVPDRRDTAEIDLSYYHFCGGVARVSLGKNEDRDAEGYINKEGTFIWPKVTPSQKELR